MRGWNDFFVAEAGASAALAGLLFVAVSINLTQILKYPHLPTRAIEALATLLLVLFVCTWALVPGQSALAYGVEIGGTALLAWIIQTTALIKTRHSGYENASRVLLNQLPPLPFLVAGVLLVLGRAGGVYWVVPGTLLSVIAGVFGAWVLLIEIQR
jgi:hypothetical protein